MKRKYRVKDINGAKEEFIPQVKYGIIPFWFNMRHHPMSNDSAWYEIRSKKEEHEKKQKKHTFEYNEPSRENNNNI